MKSHIILAVENQFNEAYTKLDKALFPEEARSIIYQALILKQAGKLTATAFVGLSMYALQAYDEVIADDSLPSEQGHEV
jgi:hypothetical protein